MDEDAPLGASVERVLHDIDQVRKLCQQARAAFLEYTDLAAETFPKSAAKTRNLFLNEVKETPPDEPLEMHAMELVRAVMVVRVYRQKEVFAACGRPVGGRPNYFCPRPSERWRRLGSTSRAWPAGRGGGDGLPVHSHRRLAPGPGVRPGA